MAPQPCGLAREEISIDIELAYGLMPLTFWGYVGVTWLLVQVTLMSVTLYLHRDATHRSVDLHPSLRHFCRCWIWRTSAMLTREWVAVHRKHHAFADLAADPHSPVNVGMRRILLEGAEFYARESRNPHTLEHYGKGAPNDSMERRIYSRYRYAGIVLLVVCELALFGIAGISMIGIQMLAMPVLAAGVINGLAQELPADLQRNQRRSYRKLLSCAPAQLDAASHRSLRALLDAHPVLGVVHASQAQPRQLWEAPHSDHLALEAKFDRWCLHAQASGVPALRCFAEWLQRFSIGED